MAQQPLQERSGGCRCSFCTHRREIERLNEWLARIGEMTNNPRIRAAVRDAQAGREVPE